MSSNEVQPTIKATSVPKKKQKMRTKIKDKVGCGCTRAVDCMRTFAVETTTVDDTGRFGAGRRAHIGTGYVHCECQGTGFPGTRARVSARTHLQHVRLSKQKLRRAGGPMVGVIRKRFAYADKTIVMRLGLFEVCARAACMCMHVQVFHNTVAGSMARAQPSKGDKQPIATSNRDMLSQGQTSNNGSAVITSTDSEKPDMYRFDLAMCKVSFVCL